MQENLKVTKYNNGDDIPDGTANTSGWGALTTGARAEYVAVTDYVSTYGYLYNWYAATDSRKICPTGWHVPTDANWTTLTTYLDTVEPTGFVGGKMKSSSSLWNSPNTAADNSSGFSALPGGFRISDGSFSSIRTNAFFWSATVLGDNLAWSRDLDTSNGTVGRGSNLNYYYKSSGASVRCLRD
jgi:uncharacterized protein (TIGR02145 family)